MHMEPGMPNKVSYRPLDMIAHRTLDNIEMGPKISDYWRVIWLTNAMPYSQWQT